MEALGRLAGGVAHDFSNLLTPILGYAQLGVEALPPEQKPVRADLQEIQKAAESATQITRQLLAFSRRQVADPQVLNLNTLVVDVDGMLRRLIGEDIELVTLPGPDLGVVKVDRGQMEQVVMNLVVNARDAMPDGGRLTLETDNVTLDESDLVSDPNVPEGEYIMLVVSDTGTGISDEAKAHIFEPFFTTKGIGEGTGLGLSTCYGIVAQSGGHISIESAPGKGACFKTYLPRVDMAPGPAPPPNDSSELPRGTETVLLVEDEPSVMRLASRVLTQIHRRDDYAAAERAIGAREGDGSGHDLG